MRKWALSALVVGLALMVAWPAGAQVAGSVKAKSENLSSLAIATIDTTSTFDISKWSNVSVFVQYDGDSSKVSIDYSVDGSVWTNLVNAVQLNGTPNTDAVQYGKVLVLPGSGGSDYYPGVIGSLIRFRLNNDDSANALADVKYFVRGRQ